MLIHIIWMTYSAELVIYVCIYEVHVCISYESIIHLYIYIYMLYIVHTRNEMSKEFFKPIFQAMSLRKMKTKENVEL